MPIEIERYCGLGGYAQLSTKKAYGEKRTASQRHVSGPSGTATRTVMPRVRYEVPNDDGHGNAGAGQAHVYS